MEKKNFFKKNWGSLLFLTLIVLYFIPHTGMPIQLFFNKLISFSPSEIKESNQERLEDYNWSMVSLDKERMNLSNSEGRVILINVWATWCPPCIAEMPSLQKLYNEYGGKVDFYFVAMDELEKVEAFMIRKGYDFPVYLASTSAPDLISTSSLPTTYIIGKEGNIVVDKKGAASWDSRKTKDILDKELNR